MTLKGREHLRGEKIWLCRLSWIPEKQFILTDSGIHTAFYVYDDIKAGMFCVWNLSEMIDTGLVILERPIDVAGVDVESSSGKMSWLHKQRRELEKKMNTLLNKRIMADMSHEP